MCVLRVVFVSHVIVCFVFVDVALRCLLGWFVLRLCLFGLRFFCLNVLRVFV